MGFRIEEAHFEYVCFAVGTHLRGHYNDGREMVALVSRSPWWADYVGTFAEWIRPILPGISWWLLQQAIDNTELIVQWEETTSKTG